MNLYLLRSRATGWNSYDACVVAAPDEGAARRVHPAGSAYTLWNEAAGWGYWTPAGAFRQVIVAEWIEDIANLDVTLIGVAVEGTRQGVVCASFNAG
jgi:hypothetical protein